MREYDPVAAANDRHKLTLAPGKTEDVGPEGAVPGSCNGSACRREPDPVWRTTTCGWKRRSTARRAPAIAAPARYWFPGLAGRATSPTSDVRPRRPDLTLAMPYARGLTIAEQSRRTESPSTMSASC